jgi:hypothetical protein
MHGAVGPIEWFYEKWVFSQLLLLYLLNGFYSASITLDSPCDVLTSNTTRSSSSYPRTKLADSSTVSRPRANIYLALSACWVPRVTRSSLVFLSSDCRARGERCPRLGVICVHQARCEGYPSKPVPRRRISHESTQSPVLSRINMTLLLYQNHIHPLYCHHHPPPSVSRFLVLSTCFSHQFSISFNYIPMHTSRHFLSIIFSWDQGQASLFLVFFFRFFFCHTIYPPVSLDSLLFIDLYPSP